MDNLTHTLVGAALAEAGLKRRTALGAATLMIGANFPDIDVVAVPLGVSFEVRRGVTHGFLALGVLPFVLAGIMWLWDSQVRRRQDRAAAPADFRQLVILAAISIATHPTLDFMNTYGMRWLMPFVDKWYYADGLFIVDVWMILMLVAGIVWSRRTNHPRWARVALLGVVAYTTAMLLVTSLGRMRATSAFPGRRLMVEPQMLVPWRRDVLVEQDDFYQFGTYTPFHGLDMGARPRGLAKGDRNPAVARARELPKVRPFLRWVRFPIYNVVSENGVTYVWISDARYKAAGWAVVEVALP